VIRLSIDTGAAICSCRVWVYASAHTLNAAARKVPEHDGTRVDGLSHFAIRELGSKPHAVATVYVSAPNGRLDAPTLLHELHHASRDLAAFLRDSGAFWRMNDDAEMQAEEWAASFQERAYFRALADYAGAT